MSKHKTIIQSVDWNEEDSGVVFINFMMFKTVLFGFKAKLVMAGSLALVIKGNENFDLENSVLMDTNGAPLSEQDVHYKLGLSLLAANFEEACWEEEHARILKKSVLDFGK